MKLSRSATALLVLLALTVVVIILLTPLGFETRPSSDLKPFGYAALVTIFLGLGLFLASIALLFRRAKLASSLAILAAVLFFIPVIGDRFGYFFSVPEPPAIGVLEYVLVVGLLVDLVLAGAVYKESTSVSSA
jgi:uncharacterized membrane protein YhaH (DUF805 family)